MTFYLAGEHGGRRFGNFLGIAGAKYVHSPLPGFEIKFVDLGQADGNQDGIHFKGFVGIGHYLPVFIEAGDGDGFNPIGSVGAHHRVAGKDGGPQAFEFVGVHLVSAYLRQGFNQGHHRDVGLDRMVTGDKPHVATTHN